MPDATKTRLLISEPGLAILRGITTPVSIVAFVGRARTGKSFSLNYMLNVSHDDGFEVGHEDRPKTRGATIWPSPTASCPNHTVVLIDTEGIGAGVQTYDKAMLILTMVLASRIVYHNDGWLAHDDIVRLYSIACLAQHYERRGVLRDAEIRSELMPHLTWVLQRYKFGQLIGPQHTAQDVLFGTWLRELENPEDLESISKYNATVRAVRELFPSHTVHLIPSANQAEHMARGTDGGVLAHITDIPYSALPEGYRHGMDALREDIFSCSVPAKGHMTGVELADMLRDIVDVANERVDYVGDLVIETIARGLVNDITKTMQAAAAEIRLPMDAAALELQLAVYRRNAEDALLNSIPVNPVHGSGAASKPTKYIARSYVDELNTRFAAVRMMVMANNTQRSATVCSNLVGQYIGEIQSTEQRRILHGDLAMFDTLATGLRDRYNLHARGPETATYFRELNERIASVRVAVAADSAPQRKTQWVLISFAAIVGSHIMSILLGIVFGRQSTVGRWLTNLVEVILVASAGVALVSGWSLVGTPPIDFDTMADALLGMWRTSSWVISQCVMYRRISVSVLTSLSLTLLALYARPHPKVAYIAPAVSTDVQVDPNTILTPAPPS
jgi:hypothetical protein